MALYEVRADRLEEVAKTTFCEKSVRGRLDLQQLLRNQRRGYAWLDE